MLATDAPMVSYLITFRATAMECGKLNDSMWGTRAMFLLTLAKSIDLKVRYQIIRVLRIEE